MEQMPMNLSRPVSIVNVGTVRIGQGVALEAARDLREWGVTSVFLVTTPPTRSLCQPLVERLASEGLRVTVWDDLAGEPSIADFSDAMATARACEADGVIGLGGGSAMDVAKLVAALCDAGQQLNQVIGVDLLSGRALPLACIPTTAGTGSEVTPIAILGDEDEDLKKGVVSPHLVPDFAYLDPELTVSMPAAVTASTGIDALTHCIEAYANKLAHPVVDVFALEGIRLIANHLDRAFADGTDLVAREAMLRASYYGGLCLGPVNTAAVHALAYPLGGEFHIAHGVANSILLPHVLRFNLEAAPARYAQIARALGVAEGSDDEATAQAGIEFVAELSQRVGIPAGLTALGIGADAVPRMAQSAMKVTRLLERNVRTLTQDDAARIYEAAL
jgi:alcohol dehydrogenase class IV